MKYYVYIVLTVCLFTLFSCEKAAEEQAWGYSLIYIPQAGYDDGRQSSNYNLTISNNALSDTSVVIGVYRSGLATLESYSVNLTIDTDTLSKSIAYAATVDGSTNAKFTMYKDCKLLPADCYTLPTSLTVSDGHRETTGHIVINRSKLFSYTDALTTKYIIPVRLASPTKYELQKSLSLAMVVITRKKI
jgi:hypothetical protein